MIRQKRLRFSVFMLIAVAVWLMSYSLLMTERTMETVSRTLDVFVRSVLPPLAVFSICAKLLVKTNVMGRLVSARLSFFLNKIGMSAGGFIAFLFGLFAGFPTGAAMLADLYEKGDISEDEAKSLLPFCNQASIAFLIGTVGRSMLNDPGVGWIFFLAQTVTAWICICLTANERRIAKKFLMPKAREDCSAISSFTSSVRESAFSMISVCGFIVFFSLIGTALFDTLAALGFHPGELFCAMIGGSLEISSGFIWLSGGSVSREAVLICGGALLGFGGISVFIQAMERTEAFFFSPEKYFKGKLAASLICPIFSVLFFVLNETSNGKILIFVISVLVFFIFYFLNDVKIKFFSKKCGKIKRNAV